MVPLRKALLLLASSQLSPSSSLRILPHIHCELDRLDRSFAVKHYRLAVMLDFFAAPGPQIGTPERRGIAPGVAERLAQWPARSFELFAGIAVLLPGLREFAVAVTNFRKPGFAIGDQHAERIPRNANPFVAVIGNKPADIVITTLSITDLLGQIRNIHQILNIELRPVADHIEDVRTRARLDCRGNALLDLVGIDRLKIELKAERLLTLRDELLFKQRV